MAIQFPSNGDSSNNLLAKIVNNTSLITRVTEEQFDALEGRVDIAEAGIATLENTIHEYEIYHLIEAGTEGTAYKPENGTIVFDQYPEAADCLIVETDPTTKRPIDKPVYTGGGNAVTGTINSTGAYVLSGTPEEYPVAIVYQVRLAEIHKLEQLSNDLIVNETEINSYVEKGEFDALENRVDTTESNITSNTNRITSLENNAISESLVIAYAVAL